ncbi:MAG: hypothetical protein Q8Q12_17890 [bacterium]|nr:hypothetical protein [bacterium]
MKHILTNREGLLFIFLVVWGFWLATETGGEESWQPVVEVEEVVCTYVPPDNGAGPLWCYGAPLIVRWRDRVFVSAMETGEGVPKLCNTRWQLFMRGDDGWKLQRKADAYREREPCPLVAFSAGRLFLSVNPSISPPGTQYGPCEPHLLEFSAEKPSELPKQLRPVWQGETRFTDHSYRGIAADGARGEILLLNIHAETGEQFWSFLDTDGKWSRQGKIRFPIRSCYPQVALKDRAAHVLAIGDIVEPNEEWRAYKKEKTGREWDYVFRRLFYAWTRDITTTDFAEPLELENLDATGGYIRNLDLWLGPESSVHVLYLKMPVQSALIRDRFLPGEKITTSLEYTILRNGNVVRRATLLKGGEGESNDIPGNARFQVTAEGELSVVYFSSGVDKNGKPVSENRITRILPETDSKPVTIPLEHPFTTFFTACERGGSAPSKIIDLFGTGYQPNTLRYARVRL